jgi:hypothetical protein
VIRVEIAVDDDDDDAFSTATRDGEGQVSKSASRRRRSKQDARNPALVMSPRMCSCCDRCPFRNTPALSDSASNRRRFDGWDDGRDFVCLIPVTERGGGNSRSRSGTMVLRCHGGKWLAAGRWARRATSKEPGRPSRYNDGSRQSYHWSARHTALIKVLQVHLVSALWDSNQAHLTSTFFSLSPERD